MSYARDHSFWTCNYRRRNCNQITVVGGPGRPPRLSNTRLRQEFWSALQPFVPADRFNIEYCQARFGKNWWDLDLCFIIADQAWTYMKLASTYNPVSSSSLFMRPMIQKNFISTLTPFSSDSYNMVTLGSAADQARAAALMRGANELRRLAQQAISANKHFLTSPLVTGLNMYSQVTPAAQAPTEPDQFVLYAQNLFENIPRIVDLYMHKILDIATERTDPDIASELIADSFSGLITTFCNIDSTPYIDLKTSNYPQWCSLDFPQCNCSPEDYSDIKSWYDFKIEQQKSAPVYRNTTLVGMAQNVYFDMTTKTEEQLLQHVSVYQTIESAETTLGGAFNPNILLPEVVAAVGSPLDDDPDSCRQVYCSTELTNSNPEYCGTNTRVYSGISLFENKKQGLLTSGNTCLIVQNTTPLNQNTIHITSPNFPENYFQTQSNHPNPMFPYTCCRPEDVLKLFPRSDENDSKFLYYNQIVSLVFIKMGQMDKYLRITDKCGACTQTSTTKFVDSFTYTLVQKDLATLFTVVPHRWKLDCTDQQPQPFNLCCEKTNDCGDCNTTGRFIECPKEGFVLLHNGQGMDALNQLLLGETPDKLTPRNESVTDNYILMRMPREYCQYLHDTRQIDDRVYSMYYSDSTCTSKYSSLLAFLPLPMANTSIVQTQTAQWLRHDQYSSVAIAPVYLPDIVRGMYLRIPVTTPDVTSESFATKLQEKCTAFPLAPEAALFCIQEQEDTQVFQHIKLVCSVRTSDQILQGGLWVIDDAC